MDDGERRLQETLSFLDLGHLNSPRSSRQLVSFDPVTGEGCICVDHRSDTGFGYQGAVYDARRTPIPHDMVTHRETAAAFLRIGNPGEALVLKRIKYMKLYAVKNNDKAPFPAILGPPLK